MLTVTINGEEAARVEDSSDDWVAVIPEGLPEGSTDPAAWCNDAGVRVKDGAVQVWVSVADDRGGFQMEVRRTEDGRMFIHLPYPEETGPHMETVALHPGTLEVVGP